MAVLYHGPLVLARHEVVRLFERFGGFRFVPFCLLVSTIFAGFLSVMLSTLLSAFSSCLLNCGLFGLQSRCNVSVLRTYFPNSKDMFFFSFSFRFVDFLHLYSVSSFLAIQCSSLELVWCRGARLPACVRDGQGALVERLGLLVLPLVGVEGARLLRL